MRKSAIRTIDVILNPWAQLGWLAVALLVSSLAQTQTPRFYSPYSEAEILEAVPHVPYALVVGRTNRHARKLGIAIMESRAKSLASLCGFGAMACLLPGNIIVISSRSTMRDIYHELSHVRDTEIEGKTWIESGNHAGWLPSR